MASTLRLFCVLCILSVMTVIAEDNSTGLKVYMSAKGLARSAQELEPKVTAYIRSLEPLSLPPVVPGFPLSCCFNFTKLILTGSNHSGFELGIVPGVGLKATLLGFGLTIHWELAWTVGITNGVTSADASISDTTIDITVAVSEVSGKPTIDITKDSVVIGKLVTGIGENLPRFIIDNIDAVLATIIDGHIENIIKTTVSKNINDGIAAVWNNTYVLEPYGVSFSYALSKFPEFTEGYLAVLVEAKVNFGDADNCPYSIPEFPPTSGDLQIDFALPRLRCAFFLAHEENFIDRAFHQALAGLNITFNNRAAVDLDLASAPVLNFTGSLNVSTTLPILANISNGNSQLLLQAMFTADAAATIDVNLHKENSSSVEIAVTALEGTKLFCGNVSKTLVPQKYQTQIAGEDWTKMLSEINNLISSQLKLPLNISIALPTVGDIISSIFTNVTVSSYQNEFLQIKGDSL